MFLSTRKSLFIFRYFYEILFGFCIFALGVIPISDKIINGLLGIVFNQIHHPLNYELATS